jgi:hypothetical protein
MSHDGVDETELFLRRQALHVGADRDTHDRSDALTDSL